MCVVGRFPIRFSFYSVSEHDGPRQANVLLTGPEEKVLVSKPTDVNHTDRTWSFQKLSRNLEGTI